MEFSPAPDAGQRPEIRKSWQTEGQAVDRIALSQASNELPAFYRAAKRRSVAARFERAACTPLNVEYLPTSLVSKSAGRAKPGSRPDIHDMKSQTTNLKQAARVLSLGAMLAAQRFPRPRSRRQR